MEYYLSTEEFEEQWKMAYDECTRGSTGRTDNHISPAVLLEVCQKVQAGLPKGTLTELIPEPDQEFLDTSLEQVLPDVKRAGVSGLEEFTMAIQVVFLQLAASADVFASLSVDAGL